MNRVDSLKRTLSFLETAQDKPNEVIVVDQTQDKALARNIYQLCRDSSLNTVYKWNVEPSLTKARNTGFSIASGDLIVFMDDDVDVRTDTFSNIRLLFCDETLAMVGGVNELEDLSHWSKISVLFGRTSYRKRYMGHVTNSIYGRFPVNCGERTSSEWAMGFFFVVRKALMDKWSLRFDENLHYYAYAEDLDFSYSYFLRASKDNMKCLLSTLLTVRHNVSTEYRIPRRKETYMNILHRRYIKNKLKPGILPSIASVWSECGDICYRLLHKEPAWDIVRAQLFYIKHKQDILKGNFHYNLFM